MFGWPDHVAGDDEIGVFVERVIERRYDAATEMLTARSGVRLGRPEVEQYRDLLSQASRLAADQDRLAEVVAGLAFDEEQIRGQLIELLSADGSPEFDKAPRPEQKPEQSEHQQGLTIRLLGSCRLTYRGRSLDCGGADRAANILRFLATQPAAGTHKEELTSMFWPEADERSARRCLHQVIYNIRRKLLEIGADGELRFQNDRYTLGGDDRRRDIDDLAAATVEARSARDRGDPNTLLAASERVNTLYRGEFLAEHPYTEWAEATRQHYRQLHREAANVLLEHYGAEGMYCQVVQLAERMLKLDPVDEQSGRCLMRAHVELGNPGLAASVFAAQVETLTNDYGLQPSAETVELAQKLLPQRPTDERLISTE